MKKRLFFLFVILLFASCVKNNTSYDNSKVKLFKIEFVDGHTEIYQVIEVLLNDLRIPENSLYIKTVDDRKIYILYNTVTRYTAYWGDKSEATH